MQILRMRTTAWELSKKDMVGGKEIQFLALGFSGKTGPEALESEKEKGRCFRALFGRECKVCVYRLPSVRTCKCRTHIYQ
jgi:hypothetical protein